MMRDSPPEAPTMSDADQTADADAAPTTRAGGIPRVVIVGRPNVGKSTLFNAIVGQRVAIEDPMAGVTRDRVSYVYDMDNRSIEFIDTGGIGMVDETMLKDEIDTQIDLALNVADLVLFVFDVREGLTPLDEEVVRRLRRLDVPVIAIANKCESVRFEEGVADGYRLGFGEPVRVSAKEVLGIADLRERIFDEIGDAAVVPMMPGAPGGVIRLAIVGRMNVGKSTLTNALIGEDRVIVSNVPGTTRDAVDVPFSVGGRRFVAIDTAGIRKKRTIADSVDFYSQSRAERAMRRADVALLMLDATRDVGRIDRQIGGVITSFCVPCIVVVNKWDLARDRSDTATFETYIRKTLSGLEHAPLAFMAATEELNVEPTLALAAELYDQAGQRVSTGELNRVLDRAYRRVKPRPQAGRIGKIYYGSQVSTYPPTIMLSVNDPKLFEDSWRRFLEHALQEELGFDEVPIRILFQKREGKSRRD